ncbi:MAG: hypothetical protein PVI57_18230 [Gemmatimonadota bacterium]
MEDLVMERIRVGVASGIVAVIVYSTFFFVDYAPWAAVLVASVFGMALGAGCIGLREFLHVHRPTFTADLGGVFGVLAGLTVMQMLVVQVALRNPPVITPGLTGDPEAFTRALDRVHFGLDVTWDMLIGAATLLFALAAARHPRFGLLYAVPGVLIAVAMVAANVSTFPTPPAAAGSVDLGPLVGLWFMASAIRAGTSLAWVRHCRETA